MRLKRSTWGLRSFDWDIGSSNGPVIKIVTTATDIGAKFIGPKYAKNINWFIVS